MFNAKCVEKIKTHFMLDNFFFFENLAAYVIMWKKYGRATEATNHISIRRRKDAIFMPAN
jgi:hypothetical protein